MGCHDSGGKAECVQGSTSADSATFASTSKRGNQRPPALGVSGASGAVVLQRSSPSASATELGYRGGRSMGSMGPWACSACREPIGRGSGGVVACWVVRPLGRVGPWVCWWGPPDPLGPAGPMGPWVRWVHWALRFEGPVGCRSGDFPGLLICWPRGRASVESVRSVQLDTWISGSTIQPMQSARRPAP